MNNQSQQKLCELVERYGPALYEEPKRLEAMLRDLCGECRREIHLLVSAALEKVPESLLDSQANAPLKVIISRLTKRLMDHLGVTERAARWSVESWGLALGVISHQDIEPVEIESEKRTTQVLVDPPPLSPAPSLARPVIGKSKKKWRVARVVLACLSLSIGGLFLLKQVFLNGKPPPVVVQPPVNFPTPPRPEEPKGSKQVPVQPQPPPGPAIPEAKPEFPRKWRVEWKGSKSKALYTGSLSINNKINDQTYTGLLLVKTPQSYEVSQDAIVYIDKSKVKINCSNSSVKKYPADNFSLDLSGNTMRGYDRDVNGNIGLGVIFTAISR